ncbi:uncharacterized protein FYW61_012533 isoform 2-T2 [Anableps anableps]
MDVQTENTDPPPNESQPTGKIRKGFKLFGKRKPGNIFSIRSKGDGNNKSPVIRSKTSEGLSETPAQDSEQEQDKETGKEVKQEDGEQPEDETLGEDGVLATAPARTSISSASSAKSLSFLSLLRGGRRGVGDRRVQTVSQPVARQRRGLKGLFSNVKLRSKDEDKEDAPPSPLLQSSRTNSVEIIKEDMTLTPKCQPRTLDSPETESTTPVQSSTTQKSSAMTPASQIDTPSSAKIRGSVQASTDSLDGAGGQGNQGVPSKTKEHHELPPKEKKTPQSKATGLSKIPVVGGGRVSRQPVRESQHDEPSKDPTSPVLEEKSYFSSHNTGGKDKISSPEANTPISKHLQEEQQQPQQAKVLTSSARDSKIPLKHGAQSHTASQVSQTKEPPRTKIPVSKVPVRRAGNKPTTTGSITQIRK